MHLRDLVAVLVGRVVRRRDPNVDSVISQLVDLRPETSAALQIELVNRVTPGGAQGWRRSGILGAGRAVMKRE